MEKKIIVSPVMYPYVVNVLKRDHINHTFQKDSDRNCYYLKGVSKKQFTVILEDALCEKQRNQTISKIPVYSYRTLKDKKKRNRLMALNRRKGFHILKADITRCRSELLG